MNFRLFADIGKFIKGNRWKHIRGVYYHKIRYQTLKVCLCSQGKLYSIYKGKEIEQVIQKAGTINIFTPYSAFFLPPKNLGSKVKGILCCQSTRTSKPLSKDSG